MNSIKHNDPSTSSSSAPSRTNSSSSSASSSSSNGSVDGNNSSSSSSSFAGPPMMMGAGGEGGQDASAAMFANGNVAVGSDYHLSLSWNLLMRPPCRLDSSYRVLPTPGATRITRRELQATIEEALELVADELDFFDDNGGGDFGSRRSGGYGRHQQHHQHRHPSMGQ